ncbi:hypothetical protein QYF36_018714 [Acer negundo]|nr:hypothetical protein QYF36_018714 [Acer negundo]
MEEDTVYVAVGKDVNESKLILSWALRNFRGDNFCILHVHRFRQTIVSSFLDHTAGDWSFVEAKQLAHMALRCCDIEPSKRPDLVSEVWRVLKPMRGSSSFWTGSRGHSKPPIIFHLSYHSGSDARSSCGSRWLYI